MVAYQVLGEGPFDVVYVPGAISHVELQWDAAGLAALLRGLAGHARVLVFDKRGTGMSDRVAGVPALEERSDDIRAVMDAARSDRAALVGVSEGVPMSVLFAASHPECVTALVLYGGMARTLWARLITRSGRPSGNTVRDPRRTSRTSWRLEVLKRPCAAASPRQASRRSGRGRACCAMAPALDQPRHWTR